MFQGNNMGPQKSGNPPNPLFYFLTRFSDPDRLLNRKRKRVKVFEVKPRSNRDDVIINLIIILI